jgi:hypothetical protein
MQVKSYCQACGHRARQPSLTYLGNVIARLGTVTVEHLPSEYCDHCRRAFVNRGVKEATLRRYATTLAAARPTMGRAALKGELEKLAAQLKRL